MHAEEIAFLDRKPAAADPWQPVICSTWAEARAVHPFLGLIRVINLDTKTQTFIPLPCYSDCADYALEGLTAITPAPDEGFPPEEHAALLQLYDAGPYIPRQ